MTANLAAALAQQGLSVGVMDADIYGFSIPRMLGISTDPQVIDGMIIPPVGAGGVKVISIGMFVPDGQPVIWRGPMLHRALQQFLADVFWGDLDVLLIDMPPGTGDLRFKRQPHNCGTMSLQRSKGTSKRHHCRHRLAGSCMPGFAIERIPHPSEHAS